jgi:hypothetical protein
MERTSLNIDYKALDKMSMGWNTLDVYDLHINTHSVKDNMWNTPSDNPNTLWDTPPGNDWETYIQTCYAGHTYETYHRNIRELLKIYRLGWTNYVINRKTKNNIKDRK